VANTVFEVFGITRPVMVHKLAALVARDNCSTQQLRLCYKTLIKVQLKTGVLLYSK